MVCELARAGQNAESGFAAVAGNEWKLRPGGTRSVVSVAFESWRGGSFVGSEVRARPRCNHGGLSDNALNFEKNGARRHFLTEFTGFKLCPRDLSTDGRRFSQIIG